MEDNYLNSVSENTGTETGGAPVRGKGKSAFRSCCRAAYRAVLQKKVHT